MKYMFHVVTVFTKKIIHILWSQLRNVFQQSEPSLFYLRLWLDENRIITSVECLLVNDYEILLEYYLLRT